MHGDFKFNLMRINLLKLGEGKTIDLNNLDGYFENKGIPDVSSQEIKAQLEHLTMENYLSKNSESEYELTKEGQKELSEVKTAIDKF